MKILKLSSITACIALLCFIISCTKETSNQIALENASTLSLAKGRLMNIQHSKKPVLTPSKDLAVVRKGSSVTITYTATDRISNEPVGCGNIKIYQLKEAEWVEVASHDAPSVSVTIEATTAGDCAYQFKAGFTPGNADEKCKGSYAGVDYTEQAAYCVKVEDCVTEFTIDPQVTAKPIGGGLYEFTVSYTLTSPENIQGVKFQGGATAGGNSGHAVTDLGTTEVVNANRNNTVLKWEGNLNACTPQVVTFKYTRNFSCPTTGGSVTGNWTAKVGETLLGSVAPLVYSCN